MITLRGEEGDDVLVGGEGNDVLEGGAGRDTFVYRSDFFGRDTILDYQAGDVIDFRGSGIGEFEVETTRISENEVLVEVNDLNSIRVITKGPLHGGPYKGLKLLFGDAPADASPAERPGARPHLTISDARVEEGRTAVVAVELSKPHHEDVTFYAMIDPIEAIHGDDYAFPAWNQHYYAWRLSAEIASASKFTIPAGQTRLEIEIQTWDNGRTENDEIIEIDVFHVSNAVPLRSVGTLTIVDDQEPLKVWIKDEKVTRAGRRK